MQQQSETDPSEDNIHGNFQLLPTTECEKNNGLMGSFKKKIEMWRK